MHPHNIGPRGCRQRRLTGWVWLAAGAVAAVLLVLFGAPRAAMLALAVPFALSAFGFLQARVRTCVVLAAMGTRDRDAPEDGFDAGAARRRAAGITVWSVMIGTAVGLLLFAVA